MQQTKRATRGRIALWAALILPAAGLVAAQPRKPAGPAPSGEGTLVINGKAIALKHAYSRTESYLDKKLPVVLLSDQPISAEALASSDAWEPFDSFAQDGRAHTVRLRFDDKGEVVKIWIHHPVFKSAFQAHPHGTFTKGRFDRQGLEGSYRMDKAEDFFAHQWQLNASFKVPMPAGAAVP